MKTKPKAIFMILLSTFIVSIAQLFYKIGADKITFDLNIIYDYPLFIGILLYCTAAIILVRALRYGELSILYPIYATNYIWVSLLAVMFLGDIMNILKWLGIFSIILGVTLIGVGSKR